MEQWVQRVRAFSSQYNDGTWAAHQVIGPAKVYPRYGDINGAWAQSSPDANEFLEVSVLKYSDNILLPLADEISAAEIARILGRNKRFYLLNK